MRFEMCKFRSVRSNWALLGAAASANILVAALVAVFVPDHLSATDAASTDPVRLALAGLHVSQIAIGVLGVLAVTSEYSTGLIRSTFAAVPHRRLVLAAKLVVLTGAAAVVGIGSCMAGYSLYEALVPGTSSVHAALTAPGVLRAAVGGGLYLTVVALLGTGLGALLRSSAGAVAALLGLLFIPTIVISVLPTTWQDTVGRYLPMNAGEQVFIATRHEPHTLGAWTGLAVFALYAAAALAGAFALITRRDV